MADDTARINRIASHFEEEAKSYDDVILRLIPNYTLMVDALVSAIPFDRDRAFSLLDLGCGTGTVSKAVRDRFPSVQVTCVDIAENMLEIANVKLGGSAELIRADFHDFEFPQEYAVIASSLALHHLETDRDKLSFYRKIFSALSQGGMFINIDVVLGSDDALTELYMRKWKDFMVQNISMEEVKNKWLPNNRAEDRPASLISHLSMLKESGFSCMDVIYKNMNYAVYLAKK